ncbi:MAG TPA: hypothetical protein VEU52_07530 [Candidatus Limnocylindrales bacterium]|nr:hypothetical protein [Candidatus Limnocylindrales bacterium]
MMRKFAIRSALLTLFVLAISAASYGQVVIQVGFAPPPLPVYVQPICPGDGYIWTPGYWAWDADGDDYYWVPGTWVLAPEVGFFWTPGWWGWGNGFYLWHAGYWGPHVGFYGGVNYGFGYFGTGFVGGRWDHDHFYYNREVTNINVTVIHNVYNERVNVREEGHVSFNGGEGGINARPTREEEGYDRERHLAPVAAQVEHRDMARSNRELRASYNHGKPPIAATARPGNFSEHESAKAAGGNWSRPANVKGSTAGGGGAEGRNASTPSGGGSHNTPPTYKHVKDLPAYEKPPAPSTGNVKLDQKYQQQQEKLAAKQEQDRLKLQQKQDQEHQRMQQQNANQQKTQQLEQKHQQQTQQMYEHHTQQQQQMQTKQQSAHQGGGKPH